MVIEEVLQGVQGLKKTCKNLDGVMSVVLNIPWILQSIAMNVVQEDFLAVLLPWHDLEQQTSHYTLNLLFCNEIPSTAFMLNHYYCYNILLFVVKIN